MTNKVSGCVQFGIIVTSSWYHRYLTLPPAYIIPNTTTASLNIALSLTRSPQSHTPPITAVSHPTSLQSPPSWRWLTAPTATRSVKRRIFVSSQSSYQPGMTRELAIEWNWRRTSPVNVYISPLAQKGTCRRVLSRNSKVPASNLL